MSVLRTVARAETEGVERMSVQALIDRLQIRSDRYKQLLEAEEELVV
jgi:hypothetical protein